MSQYGINVGISRAISSYTARKAKAFWGNTNLLGSTRVDAQLSLESAAYGFATGKPIDEVAANLLLAYKASLDCVAFVKESFYSNDTEVKANVRFVFDISDHNAVFIWAIEAWIRGLDLNFFMSPKGPPMKYSPVRWIRANNLYQPGIKAARKINPHYASLVGIEYSPLNSDNGLERLISEVLHPEASPEKVAVMVKAARKGYAKASKAYLKAKAERDARGTKCAAVRTF